MTNFKPKEKMGLTSVDYDSGSINSCDNDQLYDEIQIQDFVKWPNYNTSVREKLAESNWFW